MNVGLEGLVQVQLARGGVAEHAESGHVNKALGHQEQVDTHLRHRSSISAGASAFQQSCYLVAGWTGWG